MHRPRRRGRRSSRCPRRGGRAAARRPDRLTRRRSLAQRPGDGDDVEPLGRAEVDDDLLGRRRRHRGEVAVGERARADRRPVGRARAPTRHRRAGRRHRPRRRGPVDADRRAPRAAEARVEHRLHVVVLHGSAVVGARPLRPRRAVRDTTDALPGHREVDDRPPVGTRRRRPGEGRARTRARGAHAGLPQRQIAEVQRTVDGELARTVAPPGRRRRGSDPIRPARRPRRRTCTGRRPPSPWTRSACGRRAARRRGS